MEIVTTKLFKKQYAKLIESDKEKVKLVLFLFLRNPHSPSLKNHALKGNLLGKHSVSVKFDLRIVYLFEAPDRIKLIAIGSHSQVY